MIDLEREAIAFRKAIEKAKSEGAFNRMDRMSRFPKGCCDDTCDLFGYYLLENGIETKQLVKIYMPDDFAEKTNHAVLQLSSGELIDLTGDQFCGRPPIYIGYEDEFYKNMEFYDIWDNSDIDSNRRLRDDYRIIISYLEN